MAKKIVKLINKYNTKTVIEKKTIITDKKTQENSEIIVKKNK